MKHITQFIHSSRIITRLVVLAAILVFGSGEKVLGDELTVTSSATNTTTSNVPIAGDLLGAQTPQCEFQIPKSYLTSMAGKEITKMAFQLNTATTTWGDAEFKIFLQECQISQYASTPLLIGFDNATIVYEGKLDPTSTEISIPFTTNFNYSGNNDLLVGVYCTKSGTSASVQFKLWREYDSNATYTYFYYAACPSPYTTRSLGRNYWMPVTTFTYQNADVSTPLLAVSSKSIAFGALRASDTQTITVTNTGVGFMDVAIASDNTTDFTISDTSLTGIEAGASKTFDVTFNYNAENLGEKTANITVTPSYDETAAVTIAASATAADANVWETFDDGIPSTWYNENGSWLNYVTNFKGMACPGYMSSDILRTPRLYAEEGQSISYDVQIGGTSSSYKITAQYSTDRITWTTIATYTESGSQSFTAPATGYYWLRFTGYQSGLDNFAGWAIAGATHETVLGTATIPTKGTAHGTYTASVDVLELGGSAETVTAELYFGGEKVAEQTDIAIGGNRDVTVSLSFKPTEETEGEVYIKIIGVNIGTLTTASKQVSISEPSIVLDETSSEHPTCSSSVVKLKYTAQKGWNTIVMPFSLTGSASYMNTIFGEGWTAYAIDSYSSGELSFNKTTYMAQSTPYLVYAPNAETNDDGVYLENISIYGYQWTSANVSQTKGDITFKGTFAPIEAPDMEGKYGVTKTGTVAKGGSSASIKAYHAYLELAEDADVKAINLFIIGGDIPTDVGMLKMVEGENKEVYNLSGQKVQKATKGIYIINGKKVVVK